MLQPTDKQLTGALNFYHLRARAADPFSNLAPLFAVEDFLCAEKNHNTDLLDRLSSTSSCNSQAFSITLNHHIYIFLRILPRSHLKS